MNEEEKQDYPTALYQRQVLSALGLEASGYYEAIQAFTALGIQVKSKREGRFTVPTIKVLEEIPGVSLEAVMRWIK